jgi:hypothetical protein
MSSSASEFTYFAPIPYEGTVLLRNAEFIDPFSSEKLDPDEHFVSVLDLGRNSRRSILARITTLKKLSKHKDLVVIKTVRPKSGLWAVNYPYVYSNDSKEQALDKVITSVFYNSINVCYREKLSGELLDKTQKAEAILMQDIKKLKVALDLDKETFTTLYGGKMGIHHGMLNGSNWPDVKTIFRVPYNEQPHVRY